MYLWPTASRTSGLIPIDVLRRGGINVTTVSINATTTVNSAHGVAIVADTTFGEANFDDADLLMLPGGLPGATNLDAHQGVCDALCRQVAKGKMVSAICAAPMVLGRLEIAQRKARHMLSGLREGSHRSRIHSRAVHRRRPDSDRRGLPHPYPMPIPCWRCLPTRPLPRL